MGDSLLMEDKDHFILHSQYHHHGSWCPGDARCQDNNSRCNGMILPKYSSHSTRIVNLSTLNWSSGCKKFLMGLVGSNTKQLAINSVPGVNCDELICGTYNDIMHINFINNHSISYKTFFLLWCCQPLWCWHRITLDGLGQYRHLNWSSVGLNYHTFTGTIGHQC